MKKNLHNCNFCVHAKEQNLMPSSNN